ncbi:nucleotide sugar dehydrogenase [Natranaerobius thermophilus]|uniref:Nucleotide sugar dehydrogenase n=1 Tax=Natranaerobius thermophilus (strain ATCC BAA-1301 / DSM 18059 / JW/NM-WN-LF) TaxID=457570 RepID=B2A1P2_NATTJ|nr:nucleotide sugar dehydrogenase [Natranaerobius thermophilus]ACB86089.1 nucleotide sugar dehydrogenase [Natranaerobius thermophilus JW/NM-WN-LF]
MSINKICVMGLGYIGLPTASMLATNGFQVLGVDVNHRVVNMINQGEIHIEEPGLNTMVNASVKSGNLVASNKPEEADAFIIAVPTPINGDKTVNLDYVKDAMKEIIPYLQKDNLIVLESTVPPRTTVDVLLPLLEETDLKVGDDVFVAHCPERVLPGNILHELVNNNRIIGGINNKSSEKAKEIYEKIVQGEIVLTDATSSEMAKLMENVYRDVNIALANELSQISDELDIDALEVIKLSNMHPRVNIHQPGPGVGGHCLPVDPYFITEKTDKAQIISLSRKINNEMPDFVVEKVKEKLSDLTQPKVTVLGVSYKGNVDDTRETPARDIINNLQEIAQVKIYDPQVRNFDHELVNLEEAFKDSDIVVVLAEHSEFKFLAPNELGKLMRTKQVFDTKNCLNHNSWVDGGFYVDVLGKRM